LQAVKTSEMEKIIAKSGRDPTFPQVGWDSGAISLPAHEDVKPFAFHLSLATSTMGIV
jgi:hypothetical protein